MLHWTPREKKLAILLGLTLLLLLSTLYFIWNKTPQESIPFQQTGFEASDPSHPEEVEPQDAPPQTIWVDVKGAVQRPGVYELPLDARVYEAIELSGGLLPQAESKAVNLAKPLQDGEMVFVPRQGEEEAMGTASRQLPAVNLRVNINTASLEELDALPGIGATKAASIIDYREKEGRFLREEDLKKVTGIGEKLFEKVKDKIAVR